MNCSHLPLIIAVTTAILLIPPPATADDTPQPEQQDAEQAEQAEQQEDAAEPPPTLTDDQHSAITTRINELNRRARSVGTHATADPAVDLDDAFRQIPHPRGPTEIFDWIDDNIAPDFYIGSYRGARGTLIARAGNAADQALLAADLLERAGHDTRFVTGRLHEADARSLVNDTIGEANIQGLELDDDAPVPGLTGILTDLQDHLWLEVTIADNTRPFDPIAAPSFGITPASEESTHDSLPDTHRTSFEMTLVSHTEDNRTLEHLAVDADVADLAFRSISLGFQPDPTRDRGRFPIVSHGDSQLKGETIPVGIVDQLELQFRFTTAERESRWEQVLFRQDQGTDIFDFDHQHFTVTIAPGFTSESLMRTVADQATSDGLDKFEQWAHAEVGDDAPLDAETRQQHANSAVAPLGAVLPFALTNALDSATEAMADQLGVQPFFTRPRVVTTGLAHDGKQMQLDLHIEGDRLEALPASGMAPAATTSLLTTYGLLRDRITGEFVDSYSDQSPSTVSDVFRLATRQAIPFLTVDNQTMDRLDRFSVDDRTEEALRYTVGERNLTVLAPLQPVEDGEVQRFGWWAVNPRHGNIEGQTTDAVLAVEEEVETDEHTKPAALIDGYLELVERQLQAADDTGDDPAGQYDAAICDATQQFTRLARAFCATDAALQLPDTAQCLTDPPPPAPGLFEARRPDCEELLAPFRCAAVVGDAITSGELTVTSDDTPRAPLCQ